MQSGHRSVLLHEAIEQLAIELNDTVVDATLGGAGHALAIAQKLGKGGTLIGIDADHDAIVRAQEALADVVPKVHLVEGNFRDLKAQLDKLGVANITKALFDLGWSSYQLDSGRGFSLKADEPLLMTYSKDLGALTAARIVNEWAEESLADVLYGWGEERYSRRIAKSIVQRRETKPFTTARELAETIYEAVPPRYRFGKIHPATRTFQALRIAVNDELGSLSQGLGGAWQALSRGGRIAVITFHSIEDRLVKQTFKQWEEAGEGKRITPKDSKLPTGQAKKFFVVPTKDEVTSNPRARSAKLRVIQKI
ncbi:16S rRNA (cytosine(1402)-N(4))-methyltransferase [Candidatus Kaiserbacteria bacterium RIFCSPHIGHO2_02_FULL_55_20]|uniref:Ribosomal RNA small subunit methyltransferase H n=1 Tax=Candidatus Kaiserbacteria bacterium RIFCSPHIGHO2_02_FULL_55_20 TaxID=1798497 RepID=A0A1F6DVC4_9BACT|nr:MAG: 16S rRNA (cytosine(1402)-N(4))-methyltransferase [Candidatus Kaiserbacteria bacterium RIFCSPHIGHO2_01_FULL_55_37]OGG65336.1 MAG: 16S rRNA (cytosine(1402)-N(4))-methyltransferase [Candidatus Kaiserbacteria bacterium RIFCSPHIGHO2_02_FULL_55_20]